MLEVIFLISELIFKIKVRFGTLNEYIPKYLQIITIYLVLMIQFNISFGILSPFTLSISNALLIFRFTHTKVQSKNI